MRKTSVAAGISAALIAGLMTTTAMAQLVLSTGNAVSNVVTFGDSLSDGGNFKALNPGAAFNAPYLGGATFLNGAPNPLPLNQNRFTNGPTWAELLAAQTGAGAPLLVRDFVTALRLGQGLPTAFSPYGFIAPIPAGANVNFAFGASRTDTTPALVGTQSTLGAALGIQGVIASAAAVGAAAQHSASPQSLACRSRLRPMRPMAAHSAPIRW